MMSFRGIVLLLTPTLVASGCAGDDHGSEDPTTATAGGTATSDATTTTDATTTATVTATTATTATATTNTTTAAETTTTSTTDATTAATSGDPTGPDPDDPALECGTPPCFNVINRCPFPLWIHAENNDKVVLEPDLQILAPAEWQQYPVPAEWPAGRINAYYADPGRAPEAHDKVEVTVTNGIMNYNITYVDYVALPSEMRAVGPECQPNADFDPAIGCYVPRAELLASCPDDLLAGERCLSANLYCADAAHKDSAYCHALDAAIDECAATNPDTCGVAALLGDRTPQVYGCSGYFDSQPANCMPASETCHQDGNKWCAALNRGMLAAPDSADTTQYYTKAPYNTYARWVHDTCPGIYAFAYDDYPSNANESGFRACKAPRLDVVFCPAG